jgi:hypothetical protein
MNIPRKHPAAAARAARPVIMIEPQTKDWQRHYKFDIPILVPHIAIAGWHDAHLTVLDATYHPNDTTVPLVLRVRWVRAEITVKGYPPFVVETAPESRPSVLWPAMGESRPIVAKFKADKHNGTAASLLLELIGTGLVAVSK